MFTFPVNYNFKLYQRATPWTFYVPTSNTPTRTAALSSPSPPHKHQPSSVAASKTFVWVCSWQQYLTVRIMGNKFMFMAAPSSFYSKGSPLGVVMKIKGCDRVKENSYKRANFLKVSNSTVRINFIKTTNIGGINFYGKIRLILQTTTCKSVQYFLV